MIASCFNMEILSARSSVESHSMGSNPPLDIADDLKWRV